MAQINFIGIMVLACTEALFPRTLSTVFCRSTKKKFALPGSLPSFEGRKSNQFTDDGILLGGLEQPHAFSSSQVAAFTGACRDILTHASVKSILSTLDGGSSYCIEQSLFFSTTPSTLPHIDSFSVDSWPRGHAHTVWFALENISLEAGPPFVIPKSEGVLPLEFPTNHAVHKAGNPNGEANRIHYESLIAIWDRIGHSQFSTELRKGDVMVWHSHTVHGSIERKIKGGSRYSMQGIYLDMERDSGTFLGPSSTDSVRINRDFYYRPFNY